MLLMISCFPIHWLLHYCCLDKNQIEVDAKYHNDPKFSDRQVWANSADPDPRGAV